MREDEQAGHQDKAEGADEEEFVHGAHANCNVIDQVRVEQVGFEDTLKNFHSWGHYSHNLKIMMIRQLTS